MLTITLRDLQFRRRQFGVAVLGAGLVFGLTLLLTGMSAGFRQEARETVGNVAADAWIVPKGTQGPFTSDQSIPAGLVQQIRRAPGVVRAQSLIQFQHVLRDGDGDEERVNVIGQPAGGLPGGSKTVSAPGPGQAVVSNRIEVDDGARISIARRPLRVVRSVEGATFFAGTPTVYLNVRDAQQIAFEGRPFTSAVVTQGVPKSLPPQVVSLSAGDVETDVRRPIENAIRTIDAVRLLMWGVAALIIGAVIYLSALERVRDFAVLKAVGGASRSLALSLMLQAVLAALLAAVLAVGLARLMEPAVTVPVEWEGQAIVLLLVVATIIGVLSSLFALRRALAVDPALAFAG